MAKAATARTAAAAAHHKIAEKVLHSNFLRVLSPLSLPLPAFLSHALSLSLCACVWWVVWRVLYTRLCACQRCRQFTHTHTQLHSNKQRILCLLLTFCAKDITDIAQLPLSLPTQTSLLLLLPLLLLFLHCFPLGLADDIRVVVVVVRLLFHSRRVLISGHPLVVLVILISISISYDVLFHYIF